MNLSNLHIKCKIGLICYTGWCGLGYYRGIKSYKYYNKKYDEGKPYLYTNLIPNGFIGILLYSNPLLLPIFLHKEFYRLETDIRNLEKEKKSSYYNELL